MPVPYQRVEALVESARRRSLLVLCIEQAAIPVSLVFAGAALMLFAGTQILDWYWIVILLGAGLIAGFIRMRGRIPTAYGVAQTLDRCLTLNDTISTAWFLREHPELAATYAGQLELRQAEALAPTIDSASVLPIRGLRSWAVPGALGAVVFGLFFVRYLVRQDLDLKQPLVAIHWNTMTTGLGDAWSAAEKKLARIASKQERTGGTQTGKADREEARMNDVSGMKNPPSGGSEAGADSRSSEAPPLFPNGVQDASSTKGTTRDDKTNSSPGDSQASNSTAQEKNGSSQPKGPSGPQSQGLMNRMKDAVSSLMAKMSPSAASKNSSQSSARSAAVPDQDQTQTEGDQSKSQTNASQNSQSTSNGQSKRDEQGQAVEMPQPAASQSSSNSPHEGGTQSKSGVGRQDGSKSLKEVQELQAMGKLAEIIGKRSQDVTGDAMVDTPSGKQQLRTDYTGEVSQHSDKGGEINRDEVPLEFQQYVREYMERVHREGSKAE